jgi:WD40 repeat protein
MHNDSYHQQWSDDEEPVHQQQQQQSLTTAALQQFTASSSPPALQQSYFPTTPLTPQQHTTSRLHNLFQEIEREYVSVMQENEMLRQRLEEYERVMLENGLPIPSYIHPLQPPQHHHHKIQQHPPHKTTTKQLQQLHPLNQQQQLHQQPDKKLSQMDKLKLRTKRLTNIQKVKDFVQKSKASLIGLPIPVHEITYNWTNRQIMKRYYYHTDIVNCVQCVPHYINLGRQGQQFVASCSMDHTVSIFNTSLSTPDRVIQRPEFLYKGHKGAVNTLCFHPVIPLACTASGDGTVQLWRWTGDNSTTTTTTINANANITNNAVLNGGNEKRGSGGDHSELGIDISSSNTAATATAAAITNGHANDLLRRPSIVRDSSTFHMPTLDIQSEIYDEDEHRVSNQLNHNNNNNSEHQQSPMDDDEEEDGVATQDLLSTSEFNSMMDEYNEEDKINTKTTPQLLFDHDGSIVIAAQYHQSRSGSDYSVVSASWDRCIRQWDIVTGKLITKSMHHEPCNISSSSSADNYFYMPSHGDYYGHKHDIQISDLQSAYHNPWIVTATNNGVCKIWDSVSNQYTHQFHHTKTNEQSCNMETCAIFSPNDRNIITATQDGSCKIWDMRKLSASDKHSLKNFSVHSGVNRLSISSYHSRFCLATNKKQVKIYDLSGKCLDTLQKQGHEMMVTGACWSDNGEEIFSCSADRSIIQWRVESSTSESNE